MTYQTLTRNAFDHGLDFAAASIPALHRQVTNAPELREGLWDRFQTLNPAVWGEICQRVAEGTDRLPASWLARFRSAADAVMDRRRAAKGGAEAEPAPDHTPWCLAAVDAMSAKSCEWALTFATPWPEPVMRALIEKTKAQEPPEPPEPDWDALEGGE